ncbi:hypothetical protein GCM10011594_07110 [Nakamurella endophytica]|uniref:Polyhydroxybutyrate depolymerase n=1 Tax=Nakamurella endophytica TaxID=1748367 RepID=A0A917WC00_9ACTN|nr:hypothetical protein GCM10011594_07110 [Nakamurella endophytica]
MNRLSSLWVLVLAVACSAACTSVVEGSARAPSGALGVTAADVTPHPSGPSTSSAANTVGSSTPTRVVTLRTSDGTRSAIVHHPRSARKGAPLVVMLHPAATTALDAEAAFGFDALADRAGFVVVYPEGTLPSYQNTWNGGRCCAPASELGTDDVGFLHALVQALRSTDGLGSQVYAVGFSNGGILAYAWACLRPGDLSGVGVVAAAVMVDCADPGPVTVVAIHGTADTSIPAAGVTTDTGVRFPSVDQSLAPFRTADRCIGVGHAGAAGDARIQKWDCAEGRRVVKTVITGLGHSWPGAGAGAGTRSVADDATGYLWAQLRRATS